LELEIKPVGDANSLIRNMESMSIIVADFLASAEAMRENVSDSVRQLARALSRGTASASRDARDLAISLGEEQTGSQVLDVDKRIA
jgi:hypothetical protein